MKVNTKSTILVTTIIALVVSIVVAGNFLYASMERKNLRNKLLASTLYPTPKVLGNFSLEQKINDANTIFSENKLRGQWHLVFMGYTSCPHICPMEMSNLNQIYSELPKDIKEQLQVVMVTTDPLKDSADVLKTYVKKFNSDFIGLSGTKEQIAVFAKQFSMPFFPSNETDKNKQYEVNHSATFYLTNPKGELFALFSTPHELDKIRADLVRIINL